MRLLLATTSLIAAGFTVAPAFADEPLAPPASAPVIAAPPATPAAVPAFALMDVNGERSRLDFELALGVAIGDGSGVLYMPRVRGEVMSSQGFGGYGSFVAAGFSEGGGTGAGDLELGALYHVRTSATFDLGMHLGLALPTASDDALGTLVALEIARPSDLVLSDGATCLRLGVSPQLRSGATFARLDLGVDRALHGTDGVDTLFHANAGIGMTSSHVNLALEVQALYVNEAQSALVTGGLSVRYNGEHVSPFVALTSPFTHDLAGNVVTLAGGMSITL